MLPSPPCSPELRLLAACVFGYETALASALDAQLDWQRFAHLARYNDVQGLAGARLGRVPSDQVPADVLDPLIDALRQDAVMHLSQTSESARLVALLGAAGIVALVLKGAALAQQLYGDHPDWRRSSDIDILIDAGDLDAADKALRGAGFQRTWPEHDPPPRGRAMFFHLANVFNYRHPASDQLVELHYRIALNPHWLPVPFADLLAESEALETRFGPFRGIAGNPMLSYLCWHALSHGDYRLKWFGDLACALRREGQTSLTACLRRDSRKLENNPALLADGVLHVMTIGELGTPAPAAWQGAVAHVVSDMDEAIDTPTKRSLARLPVDLANTRFVMRLSSNWRGKGYRLLQELSDPRDAGVLGLGVRWAWLYALLGPLLAARRFVLGRRATR